jgi:signal transduction histidine kinase
MSDHSPGDAAEARRTLALLNGQADALRAELLALRQDLAQVESHFSAERGARLLDANEQLGLAASRAQAIADAAKGSLTELARATRAPTATAPSLPADLAAQLRDLREANEKLVLAVLNSQALEADAQEAHRRQITFLAMVAHELRNPLMPLTLAAQMLDRARLDEQLLLKLQGTIQRQVAHMTRLVADLLDGSRVSAGKFALQQDLVDLRDVLHRAIDTCRVVMDKRRQQFTSELPPVPVTVRGDAMRLAQVFGNLLDNASKYTPEGGAISLRMVVHARTVAVTISDNGIGITAAMLPRVFELFVQDPHAVVANRTGLGIGLAVVRELLEAHGGSVMAASAGQGLGSEFVATLPLADDATPDAAATRH